MTIQEMHYEIDLRLDVVDTEQYAQLIVPEKDRYLNRAQDIVLGRIMALTGAERDQYVIEVVRNLIVNNSEITTIQDFGTDSVTIPLPTDYRYHLRSYVEAKRETCTAVLDTYVSQHDDRINSVLYGSSFEWKEALIRFIGEQRVRIYKGDFNVTSFLLDYVRAPKYMHYAEAFGGYSLPNGTALTGFQNCELADVFQLHEEIVQLAVDLVKKDLLIKNN
jgi:hypothetical protein